MQKVIELHRYTVNSLIFTACVFVRWVRLTFAIISFFSVWSGILFSHNYEPYISRPEGHSPELAGIYNITLSTSEYSICTLS